MVAHKRKFKGLPISPGIAIGNVCIMGSVMGRIPKHKISVHEVDAELVRFNNTLEVTKNQINELKSKVIKELGTSEAAIFDVQYLLTEDPYIKSQVQHKVSVENKNLEWAISEVMEESVQLLNTVNDSYIREKAYDIRDVGIRLLENLIGYQRQCLLDESNHVIVAADNLVPSHTVHLSKDRIKGFITEHGGITSHTAILARSLGVPFVSDLYGIMDELSFGTTVAIDGFQGYVIIEPSDLQLEDFNKKRSQWLNHAQEEIKLAELEARTRDGHLIHLMANIGSPSDIDTALKADIEGIGLYRTELYFLHRNRLVSEEEQLADYKKMAQKLGNRIFTIRTLDLGGDKFFADDGKYYRELNPYLGRRAIRISLQELDVFKAQLRAIYRASTVGNIQIMFPMVSNLEEVIQIKQILYDVRKELTDGGYAYNPKVPIGIMIEIPSAALIIDSLISHVDFVSVGTNNLIQYTLAVDRSNERISYLYEPLNPAILQLLEKVSLSARRHNKKASICGEMAGDPLYTELLLGMGYETLSISSYFIPQIKSRIREIDTVQAIETAKKSITMNSCRKIKKLLQKNLDLAIKN